MPSTARPKGIGELADLADGYLQETWDAEQPIKRWLRAMKHLAIEAKVYENEGELDLAFIRFVTVAKSAEDILPTHPEWATLPHSIQSTIRSEANALSSSISSLKALIHKRSESFDNGAGPTKLARGSQPALTLRNTVQPASNSMSSSSAPTIAIVPVAKLGATAKLKKKFGLGKKGAPAQAGEVQRAPGGLAEPGAPDEDEADLREDWKVPESNTAAENASAQAGLSGGIPSDRYNATPPPNPAVPAWPPQPPSNSFVQNWVNQNSAFPPPQRPPPSSGSSQLALPGDESPDEDEGIAYARGTTAPSWDAVNVRTAYAYANPPPVPLPQTSWTAPTGLYGPSAGGWDQPSAAGASLQRAPSRLTTSHQQQQGYYPSFTRNSRQNASLPNPAEEFEYAPQDYSIPHEPLRPSHGSLPTTYTQHQQDPLTQPPYLSQLSRYANIPPPQPPMQKPHRMGQPSAPPYHMPPMAPALQRPKPPPTPGSFARANAGFQSPSLGQTPPRTTHPNARHDTTPSAPPESPDSPSASARSPSQRNGTQRLSRTGSMIAMPFLPERDSEPAPRTVSRAGSGWGPGRGGVRGPDAVGALAMQTVKEALPSVAAEERRVEPSFFAKTEDGLPLRNVILPTGLIPEFVKRAEPNTRKGIETCGLLMGTLSHNSFTITHLLIPKQDGTSDTCATTHEEEQFAFQDERELMTLGWIHTHPSQSCFMSSLDLHTHCSYQAMLAEAIAIVCSPRHQPNFGIFRLTSPLGIDTVMKCEERGMFHPHPDLPIYTDSDPKWGHARMRDVKFETHDLRKDRGGRK